MIDAPQWGQDIDRLQASGPTLIAADPLHNLMFSVHMWWADPEGTRVKQELQQSAEMNLPLVVGEFAQHAVYLCDQSPFAYSQTGIDRLDAQHPVRDGESLARENETEEGLFAAETDFECEDSVCLVVR